MRLLRAVPVVAGLLAGSVSDLPARAQAPDLAPPDGAVETRAIAHDLDEYPLPVAPFGGRDPAASPTLTVTGAVAWRAWRLPAEGRTVTSVMQGYRRALADLGYRAVLDCSGQACGGFDFRFEAALLPPPAMAMDVQDFAQLSAARDGPATVASVLVSQVRDSLYVQVVTVVAQDPEMALPGAAPKPGQADRNGPAPAAGTGAPTGDDGSGGAPLGERGGAGTMTDPVPDGASDGGSPPAPADASAAGNDTPADRTAARDGPAGAAGDGPAAGDIASAPATDDAAADTTADALAAGHVTRADPPASGQDAAPAPDASAAAGEPVEGAPLLDSLIRFGHVPVRGLAFETGGAGLTRDSAPALDDMARMLIDNPGLRIVIVGHSDNRGPLRINIEISERRAAAVREALIARGVAADRLEARGIGFLAPRRSNETEEGRTMNRRVELVLSEPADPGR